MKKIFYTLVLATFIIGCATTNTKKDIGNTAGDTSDIVRIANDSLEFEIMIIEPGFNNWIVTQQPRGYYEQMYLENRNILRVVEYNNRVLNNAQYAKNLTIHKINYTTCLDFDQ